MLHFHLITREVKQSSIIVYSRGKENWKESKFPSTSELVNNIWYIHTTEYYSGIKDIIIMLLMQ